MTRTQAAAIDPPEQFGASPGRNPAGGPPWYAPAILAVAALVAYSNSFGVPFLFDDSQNVVGNFSIKHLGGAFFPASDSVTGGRPLLNLCFALNYALGRLNVDGYHVVNLLIHVAAALVLYGVYRRVLAGLHPADSLGRHAEAIAFASALLWMLHPLQTEAVTYISQRAESLMALCYLLTFYSFVRSFDSASPRLWLAISVAACVAGVFVKELIATAPLAVLLFDRLFVGRAFPAIWRRRRYYYACLFASWPILAAVQATLRRTGVGFHTGVQGWVFAMYSCRTIVLYLKLIFWPHPLNFDYGDIPRLMLVQDFLPYVVLIGALVALAIWLCFAKPALGFPLFCFFLFLAPSHSIIPLTAQPMAEHRVYLGISCIVIIVVAALYDWLGSRAGLLVGLVAAAFLTTTYVRNRDYRSVTAAWRDVVAKAPDSARGHYALAGAYYLSGRYDDAKAEFERTIELAPEFADAYSDLGLLYCERPGGIEHAIELFRAGVARGSTNLRVHVLLGLGLEKTVGGDREAIGEFRKAIEMGETDSDEALPFAYTELARLMSRKPGKRDEAIALYRKAIDLAPDQLDAGVGLGLLLKASPQADEALLKQLRVAVRDRPDSRDDHYNLAQMLSKAPGTSSESLREYQEVLRIDPNMADANNNVGVILAGMPGRRPDAIAHFRSALASDPNLTPAYFNLGCALDEAPEDRSDAIAAFRAALNLEPRYAEAHNNLGIALAEQSGHAGEAASEFREALAESPGYADAEANLRMVTGEARAVQAQGGAK